LVLPPEEKSEGKFEGRGRRVGKNSKQSKQEPEVTGPPRFNFHKNYVQDVSDWVRGEKNTKRQMEIIKEKLGENKKSNNNQATMRLTRFPRYDVAYIVQQPAKVDARTSFTSMFLRSVTLTILDDLIMLQESENKKLAR
jgi:hypothetical protein